MYYRRLKRQAYGHYHRKSTGWRWIWVFFVVAIFLSLLGYGIQSPGIVRGWPQLILLSLSMLVACYVIVKVSLVMRWCFYWLIVATLALFIVNNGNISSDTKILSSQKPTTEGSRIVIITLCILEGLTVFIAIFSHYLYLQIVRDAEWLNTNWWWRLTPMERIKDDDEYTSAFQYLGWDKEGWWFHRGVVTYRGDYDNEGRPHGFGEWTDDAYTGECLNGMWNHGSPVGPFKSREFGTGNAFYSVRIGFAKDSTDQYSSTKARPERDAVGLTYGVGNVECSVSGKFFNHLPDATLHTPMKPRSEIIKDIESQMSPVDYALEDLITFAEAVVEHSRDMLPLPSSLVVRCTDRGIVVPGYYPTSRPNTNQVTIRRIPRIQPADSSRSRHPSDLSTTTNRRESTNLSTKSIDESDFNNYGLSIEGWRQVISGSFDGREEGTGLEALVFIHGYNCPLQYALGRLGQLLALGEFPPYIKPFVFSWPCGKAFGYLQARKVALNPEIRADFIQFLRDLHASGFQNVHILAHSMGARLALEFSKSFHEVFGEWEVDETPSPMSPGLENTANIMIPSLHRKMTIKFQPGQTTKNSADATSNPLILQTFTLLNPDAALENFVAHDYARLRRFCNHITMYCDTHDGALRWAELVMRERSLGKHAKELVSLDGIALDIDIIDTTYLDVNIHLIRHNFFNLNRMLVDDLFDVVVFGKRAFERGTRLAKRRNEGKVYTFLCAPSYVVNK